MADPKRRLRRSRNGRLNQARRRADALVTLLDAFTGEKSGIDVQDFWQSIRSLAQEIDQCVHEANAYNNIMVGDDWQDMETFSVPEARS